jgi:hypothetical protein
MLAEDRLLAADRTLLDLTRTIVVAAPIGSADNAAFARRADRPGRLPLQWREVTILLPLLVAFLGPRLVAERDSGDGLAVDRISVHCCSFKKETHPKPARV